MAGGSTREKVKDVGRCDVRIDPAPKPNEMSVTLSRDGRPVSRVIFLGTSATSAYFNEPPSESTADQKKK